MTTSAFCNNCEQVIKLSNETAAPKQCIIIYHNIFNSYIVLMLQIINQSIPYQYLNFLAVNTSVHGQEKRKKR